MNLGFIGTGKIAASVITGLCKSKISYKKIIISPRNKKIAHGLKRKFKKIVIAKNNQQIIDQFPEPQNMDQGNFLQRLSDGLEESKNKIITKLPVGFSVIANNYFWLHGRKPFKENKELSRELLRIRGSFFVN